MADFTQEQYEALNKAIAQGTLTVTYSDKTVTYRSLDEMLRIRNLMAADLKIIQKPNGRKYAVHAKNWPTCN